MKNSKENNWEQFDRNYYKKAIDSKVELVNPDLWNKISKKLDLQEEKKKVSWWQHSNTRWAWAAILLIAIGVSWQKFNPELIQTPTYELKSKSISSTQQNSIKTNHLRLSLNPSIKKVQQKEKKWMPSKFDIEESPMDPKSAQTVAQVSITDEVIKNESKSNFTDENSVLKDEVIWVRVDIKPVEEPLVVVDEMNSNIKKKALHKKIDLIHLVQQIRHVLKGEFQEVKIKNTDDVFIENKVHQVANQYIKTGEIIKQKFQ